jgi:hypothetical protein
MINTQTLRELRTLTISLLSRLDDEIARSGANAPPEPTVYAPPPHQHPRIYQHLQRKPRVRRQRHARLAAQARVIEDDCYAVLVRSDDARRVQPPEVNRGVLGVVGEHAMHHAS